MGHISVIKSSSHRIIDYIKNKEGLTKGGGAGAAKAREGAVIGS